MSDETMTDIDKLAREIADRIVKEHDGIENAWDAIDEKERDFFKQFILAGMKLQRERDAVIAENYPSPMNDLPMALAMRSVADAIRNAL